ncbi:MAG TPA: NACHT domain-containing protein [Rickettsia endosymbiont of Pyrocoelia pectoralis]|nr:NACHT domain-containing protein [Rickettsia endosymbiont of Pyrocoelia pectoralis]
MQTSLITKIKALYSSQNTLPKLIEDEKITVQSLDEYYVKLQILLNENDNTEAAALRDKVVGEKKSVEIENIFKAIDTEKRIELLFKEEESNNIAKLLNEEKNEENKFKILRKNLPNKSGSEIKNIIESINRIKADTHKILLLGSAGIGKTTLMHYLSYRWGKKELWNDKFDYVFRIKLKELLNESWSREYEAKELRQDKLVCFIHYCLDSKDINPEEIRNINDKDKVLLLLDGYDEVAFLSQNNRDYRDIMGAIFQYKNVIMTSRPNAIMENISSKFKRIVENTGWDNEGIEKYVSKNFEHDRELGEQLKSFLAINSQIKEICEVPINSALICLVWNDEDIRDKFQKNSKEDFNISLLYQEVIGWVNKRYLEKTQSRYKSKTEANNHLKNIMSFLEQIAYESINSTGKLVESKLVERKKDTLDIDEIIEQGLLRREGKNYQFIHLTFQEYLAARYLKNKLANEEEKSKTASFIGERRNEPKYLMTMKFLAGIVSNNDSQELTEIFWQSVTCNVNGILELGIERKIILLMHLLAQSEIDSRIPHLKQIQELIDDTVLKDIISWEQHIIESGYLSEAIVKTVNEKLQNKEVAFQEFKTAIEIIVGSVNRNEWGSKTKVYERLIGLLKFRDTQLQKLVLQKLIQILDKTIDEVIVYESLNRIIPLLNIREFKGDVNIILIKIISVMPNLNEEILNKQKILNTMIFIDNTIYEAAKKLPSLAEKEFKKIEELFRKCNNNDTELIAALNLIKVIKTISLKEAIVILENYIINPDADNYTKSAVIVVWLR